MAPVFDRAIFESFRKKAITDKSKLVVGNTYYIDNYGKVKLLRFLTNNEEYALSHLTYMGDEGDSIDWIEIEHFDEYYKAVKTCTISLKDNNIGASWSPWLIFDNEADYFMKNGKLIVIYTEEKNKY